MSVVLRRADHPGDLGWMVWQHGEVYAALLGWDGSFETLVAKIVTEFEPGPRSAGWIAEIDDRRVGCVLCVPGPEPDAAVLPILLVTPEGRGLGAGTALVQACVGFARDAGCAVLTLWTNDVLVSARRIYEAAGFTLVAEQPHHSFGHDLVGQTWRLDLDVGAAT